MNFVKAFTPKNTEEIKPGLFIQKTKRGYRQVHPGAWNGEMNWKNLLLGPRFIKSLMWFAIILFLAWSYFHDIQTYQEFYEDINSNPVEFCSNINLQGVTQYENPSPIQDNNGEYSPGIFSE